MGRGSSGAKTNAGISLLKGRVSEATTGQLNSVYDTLAKKDIAKMTNEEKMVRAVVIDELAERGKIIVDAKTGDYVKNTSGDRVVFDSEKGRSYRVGKMGTVQNVSTGKETAKAEAEFYFGGKWVPVKNIQTQVNVAKLLKKQRR